MKNTFIACGIILYVLSAGANLSANAYLSCYPNGRNCGIYALSAFVTGAVISPGYWPTVWMIKLKEE